MEALNTMKFINQGDIMDDKTCYCSRCSHELCTRRVPIFSELSGEELLKIASLVVRKKYSKGEIIAMEGESASSLIIINKGRIKTYRYTPEGKEQILYIFSEGDFFGEMGLLSPRQFAYNAEALEDTHVCLIRKEDFQNLIKTHPEISLKIMEELGSRLEKMESMVQNMGSSDVESRVSAVLLEFSEKYGRNDPKGRMVELPLSREGIANYIGVTRETVSRKLSRLQDEGVIELVGNKRVIILDEDALQL
jgi:CRP/FNR family transcriptional regulator